MFRPVLTLYKKKHKGKIRGTRYRDDYLPMGELRLVAVQRGYLNETHFKISRIALLRAIRGQGKYWLPLFPQHPLTTKPVGVRMGKGKGAISRWVCRVRRGNIIVSISGLSPDKGAFLLRWLSKKLPLRCVVIARHRNMYARDRTLSSLEVR